MTPGDDVEELTDAFVTASRALLAVALRSIGASPVEVTVPQHRALVLLASHGEQSVGALAEQLGVNASNASRVCDRLQRLGLVARRRSRTDARSVIVAPTEAGLEVLRVVRHQRRAEVHRVLAAMDLADARSAVAALHAFNAAADEVPDDAWVLPDGEPPGTDG